MWYVKELACFVMNIFSFGKEKKKNYNNYNKESKAMQKHIQYIRRIYIMAFFAHLA